MYLKNKTISHPSYIYILQLDYIKNNNNIIIKVLEVFIYLLLKVLITLFIS